MKFKKFDLLKKYIKLLIAFPDYGKTLKELKKVDNPRVIYIGSPIHGNLGDHLITFGALDFFNDNFSFKNFIEVPEFLYELFSNKIKTNPGDVVFVSGGGWLGDLYEDQLVVEDIIKKWSGAHIIILPQTVFFGAGQYSSKQQFTTLLQKNPEVILCVRERNTFNLALDELKLDENRCLLLPDMALLKMKNIKTNKNNCKRILVSLREDTEKIADSNHIDSILEKLKEEGYEIVKTSSVVKDKVIPINQREKVVNDKIDEFNNADLIITDRLHSMVFSLLGGTKCIAIDNKTHKVTGVYKEWLKDIKGLYVYNSVLELSLEKINKIINSKEKPQEKAFYDKFNELIERIRKYETQ